LALWLVAIEALKTYGFVIDLFRWFMWSLLSELLWSKILCPCSFILGEWLHPWEWNMLQSWSIWGTCLSKL
jgi:hypothetical protein